jgi:Na+-transporting methylmalonyl-CoA/oxaloacetate decarboxylase gamma subunit
MSVDLSVFKNIDFTKSDNLLFLFIISVIFLIAFLIFLFILSKIIKEIKKIIEKLFNIEIKKPKPEQEQKEDVDWLKGQLPGSEEPVGVPRQKISGGDFIQNFNSGEKKVEEETDIVKIQRAKEQKDVAEGLSKLKSGSSAGQSTVESKMPSRTDNQEQEDNSRQKIIIPRAKRFQGGSSAPNVGAVEKTAVTAGRVILQSEGSSQPGNNQKSIQGQIPGARRPDFVKNVITSQSDHQIPGSKIKEKQNTDQSVFGGKDEISRLELRNKLRRDPKVWKAQKDLQMNLSPVERVKLEKETFAPVFGRNISKKDLKANIKRMGRQWASTGDMKKKEFLRKEIKFFKKIGGIK